MRAFRRSVQPWHVLCALVSLAAAPSSTAAGPLFRESLGHDPETRIGPLLDERFHQGPPYNLLCPTGCSGLRCPAGCTSVAAAQIAHYHGWQFDPGGGPAVLYWGGDDCCAPPSPGAVLVADLSDSFDWSLMPDSCGGGCGGAADSALAELVYELGVALSTRYATCGSSSNLTGMGYALETYLGFAPGSEALYRSQVATAEEWSRILREDLCLGRPVPYGFRYSTGGAHDAVCDGWGMEAGVEWFHLNLGQGDPGFWFRIDETGMSDPMSDVIVRHVTPPGRFASVDASGGGEYPTIQAAIDALPSGSVIELGDGIYRGAGNVEVNLRGKAITIRSAGRDAENCVIDCEGTSEAPHRAFRIRTAPDRPFVLDGITIRHGLSLGDGEQSRDGGGAILAEGDGLLLALGCVFESNRAEWGGAILVRDQCRLLVERCVFRKNQAGRNGGAISSAGASVTNLLSCTFYANAAKVGSGLALLPGARASLDRCILASGRDGAAISLSSGEQVTLRCTDLWGNDGGDWTPPIADQAGVDGNLSVDPAFCAPAIGDLTLEVNSPCASAECGRMGALPAACGGDVFLVGDGQPYPDLASALAAAPEGGRIVLMDSLYTGPGNRDLYVECPYPGVLTIEAAEDGAAACVVDLEGSEVNRHRWMSVWNTADLRIRGVTVKHGDQNFGGALSMEGWFLTLENCAFEDCVAPGTADGLGGALFLDVYRASLEDCRFERCLAYQGGAVRARDAERLIVARCTFAGNRAGHRGGALYLNNLNVDLRESVFSGNSAAYGGALALLNASRVEAANCTLVGNRAITLGAVAYVSGAITFDHCILAGNTDRPFLECASGVGHVTCCDLWQNDPGSYGVPCLEGEEAGNVELDPLFCGGVDYHLQAGSPCLPGQPGNDGCGWIGALPAGCRAAEATLASMLPASDLRLVPAGANPCLGAVRLAYAVPPELAGREFRLTLFDAGGRAVRDLAAGRAEVGPQVISWDGCDREGRRVSSGVYFGTLRVGEARARVRLIVVR